MFLLRVYFLMFFMVSCQTTQIVQQHPPAFINPYFTICQDKEGYASVAWFIDNALKGSAELFWTSGKPKFWNVEMINPLGQPISEISLSERDLLITGMLQGLMNIVTLRDDGYLEIDGHFFPLKAQEIPCILNFKMPGEWSQQLSSLEISSGRVSLLKNEKEREIQIMFDRDETGAVRNFCSRITWSRFWGLKSSQWEWCADYANNLEGKLKFEDYIIRLVYLDN